MKKHLWKFLVVLLAIIQVLPAQADDDKIQLRLRLQEGQLYNARFTAEQKISQTIQGKKVDVHQVMEFGYTNQVLKVEEDGTATVKTTFKSISLQVQLPEGKIEYDSARNSNAANPIATVFSAMVGQSLTVKMAPNGKTLKTEGLDALWTRIVQKLDLPQGPQRAALE